MQAPSAFLLGEHSMILHKEIQKHKWVDDFLMELFGQKRSTCDHRCLFQDNFKAVMLAHQYSRIQ